MTMTKNLILPAALIAALTAALIGGSVGALVVHSQRSANDTVATTAQTTPATYSEVSTAPTTEFASATSLDQLAANNSSRFRTAQEQLAYREGFADGYLTSRNAGSNGFARTTTYAPGNVAYQTPTRRTSSSRRVYYDYGNQPRGRSFWQKHRDKLTVGIGTGAGAIVGGLIGGKKGAGIGALAGAGGSALYTYKIRDKRRRY